MGTGFLRALQLDLQGMGWRSPASRSALERIARLASLRTVLEAVDSAIAEDLAVLVLAAERSTRGPLGALKSQAQTRWRRMRAAARLDRARANLTIERPARPLQTELNRRGAATCRSRARILDQYVSGNRSCGIGVSDTVASSSRMHRSVRDKLTV